MSYYLQTNTVYPHVSPHHVTANTPHDLYMRRGQIGIHHKNRYYSIYNRIFRTTLLIGYQTIRY